MDFKIVSICRLLLVIFSAYSMIMPVNIYVLNSLCDGPDPITIIYTRVDGKPISKLMTPQASPLYLAQLDRIKPGTSVHLIRGEGLSQIVDEAIIPQAVLPHLWENLKTDVQQDLLITINWRNQSKSSWWEKIVYYFVSKKADDKDDELAEQQPFSEKILLSYSVIPSVALRGVRSDSGNFLHVFPNIRYLESDQFLEYKTCPPWLPVGRICLNIKNIECIERIAKDRFVTSRVAQLQIRIPGQTEDAWHGFSIYGGTVYQYILGLPCIYSKESIEDAIAYLTNIWDPALFSSELDKGEATKILEIAIKAKNGLEYALREGLGPIWWLGPKPR